MLNFNKKIKLKRVFGQYRICESMRKKNNN